MAGVVQKGYNVKLLDFTHPGRSSHYNPFAYIHTTQDVIKMANFLAFQKDMTSFSKDPFWDYAAFLLYCAVIERKKAGIFRCAAI